MEWLVYYDGLPDVNENARWELYDMVNDPHEMCNAYEDPSHAGLLPKLKADLHRLQAEMGDQTVLRRKSSGR